MAMTMAILTYDYYDNDTDSGDADKADDAGNADNADDADDVDEAEEAQEEYGVSGSSKDGYADGADTRGAHSIAAVAILGLQHVLRGGPSAAVAHPRDIRRFVDGDGEVCPLGDAESAIGEQRPGCLGLLRRPELFLRGAAAPWRLRRHGLRRAGRSARGHESHAGKASKGCWLRQQSVS